MSASIFRIAAVALLLAPAAAFAQPAGSAPIIAPSGTNPPGTAASRAFDRAAGTDTSGAYPTQADGTPENPRGTAVSRSVNHATSHRTTRHAQTVRNNSVTRGADRAAGTNNSGAYPAQSDGMPGNPPGTAVSRALGTTNTTH